MIISFALLDLHFDYQCGFFIDLCSINVNGKNWGSLLLIQYSIYGGWFFDFLFLKQAIYRLIDWWDRRKP